LFQEALTNQETAVEVDPRCCGPEIYVSLAGLYQAPALGKDSETVRRTFDKALDIAPDNLLVLTRYAQYLMRSGEYENALKHANAALNAPPLNFSRTGQDKALRETARDLIAQINDRIKQSSAVSATK
jgi:Tfp pilus assembly protein PilF